MLGIPNVVELDEIREELLSIGCDAHWQVRIEELMSEVERLDALLEMVARVKKAEQNERSKFYFDYFGPWSRTP